MTDLIVAKHFTVTPPLGVEGEPLSFAPGVHKDAPEWVHQHWFAQAHLHKDGKMPEPPSAAPLTHEERASVKASLDEADKRVEDAQKQAQDARDELEACKDGLGALVADNEALRARVAELEADLDKATSPTPEAKDGKGKGGK